MPSSHADLSDADAAAVQGRAADLFALAEQEWGADNSVVEGVRLDDHLVVNIVMSIIRVH